MSIRTKAKTLVRKYKLDEYLSLRDEELGSD